MSSSTGLPTVRSCLLLLLILMSAPVEAKSPPGARARSGRLRQPLTPGERLEGAESIPLDFTPVRAKTDHFLVQLQNLAQSLSTCSSQKLDEDLRLHLLQNRSVTCNDGSAAGYYMRESKHSKRWLLLLEGGWHCFSKHTCDHRVRTLMSSSSWPQTRKEAGILSPQPEENPYWWNANMVLLPYCSSDLWSGTRPKTEDSGYAFMGALIIKEVVKELLLKGLDKAKVLLLAGVSAGGIGVLVNVDQVAEQLRSQGHRGVQVRGLSDSGWFLERGQYKPGDCAVVQSCGLIDAAQLGARYWGTVMPEVCRQLNREAEWKCFFGPNIYPTIKSPTFLVNWLFDQAQLTLLNVDLTGRPISEGQWDFMRSVGQETKSTLQQTLAVFAPACLAHDLITETSWVDVQLRGTSLPKALRCWEQSLQDTRLSSGNHGNYNQTKERSAAVRSCPLHLVDRCLWPNCNPTCPDVYNQQAEREMNVLQFLKQMGLDVLKKTDI